MSCPRSAGAVYPQMVEWGSDGTCGYCGSFSGSDFMRMVEAGATVTPTDKDYKAYLCGEGVPPVRGAAKFYYEHLSQEQRERFVELLNQRKMSIDVPGHFYVLPFFCVPVDGIAD